jgi:hypothetical protein
MFTSGSGGSGIVIIQANYSSAFNVN